MGVDRLDVKVDDGLALALSYGHLVDGVDVGFAVLQLELTTAFFLYHKKHRLRSLNCLINHLFN